MRIAIVGLNYWPENTGIAPYTHGAAERLAELGHTVTVYTTYPHYPEWAIWESWKPARRTSKTAINANLTVVRLRHFVPRNPTSIKRVLSELSFGVRVAIQRLSAFEVVLCVSPGLLSTFIVLLTNGTRRRNRPRVGVWVQDIYSAGVTQLDQSQSSLATGLIRRAERFVMRNADQIIAIHERHAGFLAGFLGVPPENIAVIRNWAHISDKPQSSSAVSSFRNEKGWGEDETVILHSGNMGRKQDLANVIDAARVSSEDAHAQSRLRFVLMGNGIEFPELLDAARKIGCVDVIEPVANDRYSVALASADILLVNEKPGSRDVAVPSKLTSYFCAGKPVLAATELESATSSELEYSGAGMRVDPGRPELLYRAAAQLASDRERMESFGRSASAYFRSTLSEETAITALNTILSREVHS